MPPIKDSVIPSRTSTFFIWRIAILLLGRPRFQNEARGLGDSKKERKGPRGALLPGRGAYPRGALLFDHIPIQGWRDPEGPLFTRR